MNLYVDPQKEIEYYIFSRREYYDEMYSNIMPGKAASMIKVCNSKQCCQTGNRIRNKWDGIQYDQMHNEGLKQR